MSVIDWKTEIAIAWRVQGRLQELDQTGVYSYRLPRAAATGEQLAIAEHVLGHPIDPAYVGFLTCANGWPDFYRSVDLFGTIELLGGSLMKRGLETLSVIDHAVWKELRAEPSSVLPIAVAKTNMDLFVIGKPGTDRGGQVIWLAGLVIDRFPSFHDFFLAMVDYNRLRIDQFR